MKHTLWLMALNAAAVLILFGGLTMGWPVSPVFVEANDVAAAPDPQVSDVAYPLKASANHHCLVDQNGIVFMIVGDSPQSVIGNVSLLGAKAYIEDRA